jgi:hypothetical protein
LHVAREPTVARAGLDDEERIGLACLVPVAVECTRDARAEQGPDLGAGDEVAAAASRAVTGREEPDRRLVERQLDEAIERDRAFAPDEARDGVGRRAGQNARSPIRAKSSG